MGAVVGAMVGCAVVGLAVTQPVALRHAAMQELSYVTPFEEHVTGLYILVQRQSGAGATVVVGGSMAKRMPGGRAWVAAAAPSADRTQK